MHQGALLKPVPATTNGAPTFAVEDTLMDVGPVAMKTG
jgi:hypothetical protein